MFKRHAGHDHGATTTTSSGDYMMMDMGSSTMASTSATGLSSSSDGMSMDMDHGMDGMSMHMYFTTQFKNYPVLFKNLSAETEAQAFGIFVLLFFVAFATRSFEFFKDYLEYKVWRNPVYFNQPQNKYVPPIARNNSSDNSLGKDPITTETDVEIEPTKSNGLSYSSQFFRDTIRLILLVIPEILGYALMLAVMTYTLTYFFAVAVGSGVGKFFFDKLSFKMGVRPTANYHH